MFLNLFFNDKLCQFHMFFNLSVLVLQKKESSSTIIIKLNQLGIIVNYSKSLNKIIQLIHLKCYFKACHKFNFHISHSFIRLLLQLWGTNIIMYIFIISTHPMKSKYAKYEYPKISKWLDYTHTHTHTHTSM